MVKSTSDFSVDFAEVTGNKQKSLVAVNKH